MGRVVVDYTEIATAGQRKGCIRIDPAVVRRIIANPENYYLNYHTARFADGAIRGQLG